VGYDDEGVKAREWTWFKDGILSIRGHPRPGPIIGEKASHRLLLLSDSWNDVQFQRMPNVSLRPGTKRNAPEMIAGVERMGSTHPGRRLVLDRPAALQLPVRRRAVLRDQASGKSSGCCGCEAYQSNTQEFWNSG